MYNITLMLQFIYTKWQHMVSNIWVGYYMKWYPFAIMYEIYSVSVCDRIVCVLSLVCDHNVIRTKTCDTCDSNLEIPTINFIPKLTNIYENNSYLIIHVLYGWATKLKHNFVIRKTWFIRVSLENTWASASSCQV